MKFKNYINLVIINFIIIFSIGCGEDRLNLTKYKKFYAKKAFIPKICEKEYKFTNPKVAVVNFTNNSTFGKANINKSNNFSQTGLAVGVTPTFIGAVAGSKSKSYNEKRKVDAKLSQSIVPIIENMIINLGGAEIFTREDMKKIDAELKFQDSGLIDPQSAVEFGKLSGVQYLVTGSIDNVEMKYRDLSSGTKIATEATKNNDNEVVKYGAILANLVANVTDGMKIRTRYTIKILDVRSGKIIFSKQLNGETNIGKIKHPTFDQIVGGIKASINKSLPQINKDFSNFFTVKGYITDIRANKDDVIVRINLGSNQKVTKDSIFKVYTLEQNIDPLTNKKSCDKVESEIILKATCKIGLNYTWATIESGNKKDIKILQLVQKISKKDGLLSAIKF